MKYNNGMARLCTTKYTKPDEDNMDEITMHLTNYAINKKSEDF